MADGQRTPLRLVESQTALKRCLDMFLLHQEASGNSPRTIKFYRNTRTAFLDYLQFVLLLLAQCKPAGELAVQQDEDK